MSDNLIANLFFELIQISLGLRTSLSIISFILFLAFMKFYRRYSLEIFMMLISDDELLQSSNLKYSNYVNVNIQSR